MNSKGLLSTNLALLYSSKPNGKLLSSITLHAPTLVTVLSTQCWASVLSLYLAP